MDKSIHVVVIILMVLMTVYAMLRLRQEMKKEPVHSMEKGNKKEIAKRFSDIDDCLQILKTTMKEPGVAPEMVSEVIEALVYDGYIPVHLMTNEGNNYSDRLQKSGFRCMLSSGNVQTINKVEGRNG